MNPEKARLRAEYRALRAKLSPEEVAKAGEQVTARLRELEVLRSARTVFSYVEFGREVPTRPILRELLQAGKLVVAPAHDRLLDQYRCFHFLSLGDPLLEGARPDEDTPDTCDLFEIRDAQVFLVPGLVWDERGWRIGFGGGYFDRILAQRSPNSVAIGLAYEFQIIPRIPLDPWDRAVDLIVTPERVILTAPNVSFGR
ncbi:MAG: 5-formyltetrahydrofolate cyclo-ligase [Candidatus Hydrogenedentota bacterium]|jgi:5-formyltetrahydrofolate cyclo-ligase|uniref:5-formyltetrahydrofolate cyclo-ligase n=1 Tax=Sumerlaea chitinivorans TaxID=2250252 RepID=A0A2Z4Y6I7_SUMC1|nr:5-formyltetrahydrofolate cyclo-ligase [Candidatus Sumerlaea chitinivorans]RMH28656.1 MAG: 5-formyltetrahydrofolate cyclo-ligase [Candidatus Hydrogenedentota bacterium]GIX45538.1 MAG: 5-formyltetrahydrofolate cyclo-ligase [Candidatus Sumerlaea sp.]